MPAAQLPAMPSDIDSDLLAAFLIDFAKPKDPVRLAAMREADAGIDRAECLIREIERSLPARSIVAQLRLARVLSWTAAIFTDFLPHTASCDDERMGRFECMFPADEREPCSLCIRNFAFMSRILHHLREASEDTRTEWDDIEAHLHRKQVKTIQLAEDEVGHFAPHALLVHLGPVVGFPGVMLPDEGLRKIHREFYQARTPLAPPFPGELLPPPTADYVVDMVVWSALGAHAVAFDRVKDAKVRTSINQIERLLPEPMIERVGAGDAYELILRDIKSCLVRRGMSASLFLEKIKPWLFHRSLPVPSKGTVLNFLSAPCENEASPAGGKSGKRKVTIKNIKASVAHFNENAQGNGKSFARTCERLLSELKLL